MIRHRTLNAFIFCWMALILSACSVADLEKPITEFASATQSAETALINLNQEVTTAYAELLKRRALAGEGLINFQSGDCLTGSKRCRLELLARNGNKEALTPKPALRKMIVLMGSIRAYADGLTAIVSADTAAKVETSVNETVGSVVKLADTVKALGGQDKKSAVDLSEYATPVGELINWFIGQYIAKVKLRGLKRATKNSKEVVAAAANIFGQAADTAAAVPKAAMAETIAKRIDAFDDNRTESNFNSLIESAAAYDQFLLAKPPNLFVGLVAAHNALVDKLQDEEISLAFVIAQIKVFSAEAKTIARILKALADARGDKQE